MVKDTYSILVGDIVYKVDYWDQKDLIPMGTNLISLVKVKTWVDRQGRPIFGFTHYEPEPMDQAA